MGRAPGKPRARGAARLADPAACPHPPYLQHYHKSVYVSTRRFGLWGRRWGPQIAPAPPVAVEPATDPSIRSGAALLATFGNGRGAGALKQPQRRPLL